MSGSSRRTGKVDGTKALATLVGMAPPTVAGGTIPREWMASLVAKVFGDEAIVGAVGKRGLLRRAIEMSGGQWREDFVSQKGSTITGEAVWYLHDRLQALSGKATSGVPSGPPDGCQTANVDVINKEKGVDTAQQLDELDLGQIAFYLSELSRGGQLPAGCGSASGMPSFGPDVVDFNSNDWVLRTLGVQAWLCLDGTVENDNPKASATYLMEQVSPDPAESCIRTDGDNVALTKLGAQHLDTWLSRAVAHREAFLEAIEDDRSPKEASEEWRLLWEESRTLSREPSAIKAQVGAWKIKNLSDLAKEDKLELNPSYQRDSVWSVTDSQTLIESILRGIPLPSIILTKSEDDQADPGRLQIVDGKQRLTAILRFIGRHPAARRFIADKSNADEFDKDFYKFARRHHLTGPDIIANCLPFKVKVYKEGHPLSSVSGKYYCEIANTKIQIGGSTVAVSTIFDSVTSDYLIPVIIYEQTRLQDIHEVFSIYNKQGKKLNAEELRNAMYHDLGLTRLMLVLSGDRPDHESLAPYLPPDVTTGISKVGRALEDLGFGTARFKRTKVLSWVSSILLHPPSRAGNRFSTPSTAGHINGMLGAISRQQGSHPMFQSTKLVTLARDIARAVVAHNDAENAWHPMFRSKKPSESGWEELPLVASLLTSAVLVALNRTDLLTSGEDAVRDFTDSNRVPKKVQNRTQWWYIATILGGVLDVLGVDPVEADVELKARYGYGCLGTMRQIASAGQ